MFGFKRATVPRYPSLMTAEDQASFVANTETDCQMLDTSATVAWEFAGSWANAIKECADPYPCAVAMATCIDAMHELLEVARGILATESSSSHASLLGKPRVSHSNQ